MDRQTFEKPFVSVIEKVQKAGVLSQAGNYEEALTCLIEAQSSDPWNGYILDLTWRVETLCELSKLGQLSSKDEEEFKAWLPAILQRMRSSATTLQPFRPIGPISPGETAGRSADNMQRITGTAKPQHAVTGTAEDSMRERAMAKHVPTIEPGDHIALERERLLSEMVKRQATRFSPPEPSRPAARSTGSAEIQEPRTRPFGVTDEFKGQSARTPEEAVRPPQAAEPPVHALPEFSVLFPPASDEKWRAETGGDQGALEYEVKPSARFFPLRKALIAWAIFAPLLVAGVVFYSLTRNRSVTSPPVQTPQSTTQSHQGSITEKKPDDFKIRPSRPASTASRDNIAARSQSPTVPLSKNRSAKVEVTAPSSTGPSSQKPFETSSPEMEPVKQLVTPPAIETPNARTIAPVPVDTPKIAQVTDAGPSPPVGPNKVTVRVYIGTDGKPLRAEIISSTNPSYNTAAIEAAMKSTFTANRPRIVVTGFIYP